MELIFYFPANYKHGQPEKRYYRDIVNITSIEHRTQEFLCKVFSESYTGRKFNRISFKPFVYWNNIKDNIYIAEPRISIWYGIYKLNYLHIPSYYEVKFDFEELIGSRKNDIPNTNELVLPVDKNADGLFQIMLGPAENEPIWMFEKLKNRSFFSKAFSNKKS